MRLPEASLSTEPAESSIEALLAELERLDIRLWVEEDRLRFDAPQGAMSPQLRERLKNNKNRMIEFLLVGNSTRVPAEVSKKADSNTPAIFPATFSQRHFGQLQRLHPGQYFYNVPFAFRLKGKFEVALLAQSLKAMLRRHDFLRTTLREVDHSLTQVVAPFDEGTQTLGLPVIDLREIPASQREEKALEVMRAEWRKPFDLEADCPLRVRVLRLSVAEHLLFLCLHNVSFEAGSLGALFHELGAHYAAFANGRECALPALPMQYADCARWQQALTTNGVEQRLNYWREWFRPGEPPPLTLRIANRSQPATSFDAGILDFEFEPQLTEGLKQLCQRCGVTLFIPILAAYALVLKRHSGLSDIVFGTTFANRNHWKLEPLIGSLLNIVALRFDLSGESDFLALLRQMREIVLAAFSQQEVPFPVIAPLLEPGRTRSVPLFRTVLSFLGELPNDRLQFPGVEVTALDRIYCDSMFPDLYPTIWENKTEAGTALKGYWQYKRELYEESKVQKLLFDFQAMLETMVRNPQQSFQADCAPTP